jgi:hypothetical protein
MPVLQMIQRHRTHAVAINGVLVGAGTPVVVQSMTNTDTGGCGCDGKTGRGAVACRLRVGAGDG